jgi:hypothetical protein
MKKENYETFGEVIKGKTTGTIYFLIEGEYRVLNRSSVISTGAIPKYSKNRTIKLYALIDENLVEYTHPDKVTFNTYKTARKTIEGIESDSGTWSPQKKVEESFKLNQTELEWSILLAQSKVEYLKNVKKLEVQQ